MTLHDYVKALTKHWLVIVLLIFLGAGAGYGFSQLLDERFRSETTVMISPARGDSAAELVQGSSYVQSLVDTYAVLARSPVVLQPVIDELGLTESTTQLAARTDVNAPLDTVVIQIGVTDASPESAAEIADAIATEFALAVAATSPEDADGDAAVRVSVIAPARLPVAAVSPNTRLNTLVGGGIGGGLGVLAALALRRFGSRISTAADVQDGVDLPVLGSVGKAGGKGLVAALRENPSGRVAESVRQAAAALKFVDMDQERRVLMVTSAAAGEGKSAIATGLALTLADVGHRVLLIEADLRRPSISTTTGLNASVGLTSVLVGDAQLGEATQLWGNERLHVLTSGPLPPDPGHLLTSDRMRGLVAQARKEYEYVVIDATPSLAVSDALWIAPSIDGTILVVRADRSKRDQIRRAAAALAASPAPTIGVVLNGVTLERSPYGTRTE